MNQFWNNKTYLCTVDKVAAEINLEQFFESQCINTTSQKHRGKLPLHHFRDSQAQLINTVNILVLPQNQIHLFDTVWKNVQQLWSNLASFLYRSRQQSRGGWSYSRPTTANASHRSICINWLGSGGTSATINVTDGGSCLWRIRPQRLRCRVWPHLPRPLSWLPVLNTRSRLLLLLPIQ